MKLNVSLSWYEATAGKLKRDLARRKHSLTEFLLHELQGNSMVEFALVLPIVLTLLTGISAFGVAFNNQLTLNRAIGAGAQHLQIIRTTTADPCADTFTAVTNAAPNLTPASITLTFTVAGQASIVAKTCPTYLPYLVSGQIITVSATYPCTLLIYGTKALSSCMLSAQVTEYEY